MVTATVIFATIGIMLVIGIAWYLLKFEFRL